MIVSVAVVHRFGPTLLPSRGQRSDQGAYFAIYFSCFVLAPSTLWEGEALLHALDTQGRWKETTQCDACKDINPAGEQRTLAVFPLSSGFLYSCGRRLQSVSPLLVSFGQVCTYASLLSYASVTGGLEVDMISLL
ncbi:hypothetical protein DQ04_00941020 [Trypanosoma grayi]|uniref:hypothetical protein n=1 Tax=Trypanosoma grayi TaxID=71804 RepID=UPI0004F491C4|nr:hypothetical protein DQ04_00941020 [Trypanosoma grayi]KEG13538.1 hypothetical protein DQ04_00941020 [Trypanosoma grayi]